MTPEEARAKRDADQQKLRDLEAAVQRMAEVRPGPVILAITRALIEMVCARDGAHFVTMHKTRFYTAVVRLLAERGIV